MPALASIQEFPLFDEKKAPSGVPANKLLSLENKEMILRLLNPLFFAVHAVPFVDEK